MNSVVRLLLVPDVVVISLVRDLSSLESGREGCHHHLVAVVGAPVQLVSQGNAIPRLWTELLWLRCDRRQYA